MEKNPLISGLILWIHPMIEAEKKNAFDRIKLKALGRAMKKIDKFQIEHQHNPSQYLSITDFKPFDDNYSSIKIPQVEQGYKQQSLQIELGKQIDQSIQKWLIRHKTERLFLEDYPMSDFTYKKIAKYDEDALLSIKNYPWVEFRNKTLRKNSGWFFKDQDSMTHSLDPIKNSLITVHESKIPAAVQMFECLLMAGLQLQGQVPPLFYLHRFIEIAIKNIEDLREQAYFQVIKQINGGKKLYLSFLACLCVTVQPSIRMYIPLLNYLYHSHRELQFENYQSHFSYIFFHLIKNFSSPRTECPSIFQLTCYKHLKKVPVQVSFPYEKFFFIEPYTTVQEMISEMVKFYALDSDVQYLLSINGILMQKGILLDQLNLCSQEDKKNPRQKYVNFQGYKAIIVLKNMQLMNSSLNCFNLMFNYILQQYYTGVFMLSPQQFIKIGGFIIASQVEDQTAFEFNMNRLIPRKKIPKVDEEKFEVFQKHILSSYYIFKGGRKEARKQILSILESKKGYLTHFFKGKTGTKESEMISSWIGLKCESMFTAEPKTGRIMKSVEYKNIPYCKLQGKGIQVEIQSEKYYIETLMKDTLYSVLKNNLKSFRKTEP